MPTRLSKFVPSKAKRSKRTNQQKALTKTGSKYNGSFKRPYKVSVGRQLLPPQLFNSLKYCDLPIITTDVNGLGFHQFSTNSLFKPNTTAAGHQPQGFDNLALLYDHYTVISSSMKFSVTSYPDNGPLINVLYIDDDATIAVANVTVACERDGAQTSVTRIDQMKWMSAGWNAERTFGGNVMSNDELQGTGSTSPNEQSHFTIIIGGTPSVSYVCMVEIQYNVVWDEIKSLIAS